ncbi:hydroxyacid dehydrogenase, partial [Patescibacteria group bacterium]|nr:hydroxyacid dehydrogenase [Patescibacteria group bacterium]MBU1890206.1 hydroxyacid dehydrogenase [Patescibacteria group bacterium]
MSGKTDMGQDKKPTIVVTKNLELYEDQTARLDSLGNATYYNDLPRSDDEWLERCRGADIICTGMYGLKSEKVYELDNVFISLPFVGAEFLDRNRLKEKNITVSNSPGGNKEAVAEWIIGMMIMHFRRLPQLTRTTDLQKEEILKTATSLYNKKITILGVGHIGKQLGNICESFGMIVKYFKRGDDLIGFVKDADVI